jgi:hypothetical protein
MTRAGATMDTTFLHTYECQRLTETPSTAHYYFPSASMRGGRDGILVEVRPARGLSWLGTFASGRVTLKGVSGIFTTPNPQQFCVVSSGEGYFISAMTPTEWEPVRSTPIIDVRPILAREIIVFADFTELVAYG